MKIKDLITEDIDIDVYDDYDERCGMALVGPVKLTELGRSKFGGVLGMHVEVLHSPFPYGYHAVVHCDSAEGADLLKEFLLAAAGYVSEDLYRKWFVEV